MELGQGPSLITQHFVGYIASQTGLEMAHYGMVRAKLWYTYHNTHSKLTSDSRLSHLYIRIAEKGNNFACSSSKITVVCN